MALALESHPQDVTEALPTPADAAPDAAPPALRLSRRRPVVIAASGLALLLAGAVGVATWPSSAPAGQRPAAPALTNAGVQSGVQSGSQAGTPQGQGPSAAPGQAVPGTRTGASAQAGTGAPAPAPSPSSTPWTKRDPAVLSPSEAAYFIAGTIYGDPPGNRAGLVTISSASATHLRRGATSGPTLTQLGQAVKVLGGQYSVAGGKTGGGRAAFTLPAGRTIVLDTHGSVRINGVDAFGLRRTATGWTSTATGPQVRAFLAGFIEGEGSVGGKIGDDPTAAHLAFIQALMSTSQAYGVRTVLHGTSFFGLSLASMADAVKVQAYPFITYARCPGGRP